MEAVLKNSGSVGTEEYYRSTGETVLAELL